MADKLKIIVRAGWDDEAKVWVATSDDVAGLAVEAATMEALQEKVIGAVEDLLELNGVTSDLPEVPVCIMSHHLARLRTSCA